LGDTRRDQVAVLSGIKAGEIVVSGGQMKLRNGTPVAMTMPCCRRTTPIPNPPNE